MSLLASTAIALLPSVGKFLVKAVIQPEDAFDGLSSDILEDVRDLLKDRKSSELAIPQIMQTAAEIAKKLQPIYQNAGLDEGEQAALLHEFTETLIQADIDTQLLIDANLRPELLELRLRQTRPDATAQLSAAATQLYQRLLKETAIHCISIANEFASYQPIRDARFIDEHAVMQEYLQQVLALLNAPQQKTIDFERRYLKCIVDELNTVDAFKTERLKKFAQKQALNIAYIRPRVRKKAPKFLDDDLPQETINDVLAQERRVVLRGEAGTGKTTVLKWLAVSIATQQFSDGLALWNNTIPFYIPLRQYRGQGFPAPEEFIKPIASHIMARIDNEWVHGLLENGRAVVLIDGMDELGHDQRDEFIKAIKRLVRDYPNSRYIISSRPTAISEQEWSDWNEWLEQTRFVEVDIEPMERTEIEMFIEHWHKATNSKVQAEMQAFAERLKKVLWQRPDLYHLATNPLLCAMICALHYELKHQLPTGRLKLYDECIELMLKLRDDTVALSSVQKRSLLQVLAFRMQRNGESELDQKLVKHIFENELPRLGLYAQEASAVLDYFVQKSGLLREPVLGKIEFIHRTFQDFL